MLVDFEVTSEATPLYNCFAWALGNSSQWVDPTADYGYWPPYIPNDIKIDSIIELFHAAGFEVCGDSSLVPGHEKVAVYAIDGEATHAARQLANGMWTSKLGRYEDIVHASLEDLEGEGSSSYGRVAAFMIRPISND